MRSTVVPIAMEPSKAIGTLNSQPSSWRSRDHGTDDAGSPARSGTGRGPAVWRAPLNGVDLDVPTARFRCSDSARIENSGDDKTV